MAKFIKCSCEDAEYMYYKMHNSPVKDELLLRFKKFKRHIILTKKEHQQYNFTELTKSGFMQKIN